MAMPSGPVEIGLSGCRAAAARISTGRCQRQIWRVRGATTPSIAPAMEPRDRFAIVPPSSPLSQLILFLLGAPRAKNTALACAHAYRNEASESVRVRVSACGASDLSVLKYFVVVRLGAKNTFFIRRAHSAHRGMETSAGYQCT